jgi:hypothetical protein
MSRSAKRLRAWRAGRPRCCRSRAETLAPFQGSTHRALTRPAARSRLARTVRPLARGRRPVDARTGKIASPADGGRPGIGCRGNPAIMRRASHRVLTPRTHPTTRRLSRLPCPPSGDGPASRRPDLGGCDSDRRGRNLPSLGLAGGSRRWAIRWAKPCRIGPYQDQRLALTGLTIWPDLQVFHRPEGPRTPCFTRERTLVRNQPRPSRKGRISRHFVGVAVRTQYGRGSAIRPSSLPWPAT